MTSQQFVENFYLERRSLLDLYLDQTTTSDVSMLIADLQLDQENLAKLRQVLNGVLRDAFYGVLLGLDGEVQIGERQENYKIEDENGNKLSGEIESFAWEYFHNYKFERENSKSDFIATLTYRTTEQGGRKTPAKTGYRPQTKFDFDEMQTSGQQLFIDCQYVYPGGKVDAEIKIVSADYFAGRLTEGMEFEFREGSTIMGRGKIKHVLNELLRKK
ncbi:MAG: hypothetical protein EOO20_15235 [Chryseobacterium sp.]|nr:MAG: hypothetical protein EOO20_15235 [Chryseobacterium sp.]